LGTLEKFETWGKPVSQWSFSNLSTRYWVGLSLLFLILPGAGSWGEVPATQPVTAPVQTRDAIGTVTISDDDSAAVIRYTLDGSDPDKHSGRYLAPIELAQGGLVKARAFSADGKQASAVVDNRWPALPGSSPLPSSLVPVTQDRSAPGYVWADRHSAACAAMKQRNPQLIFVGDSITHFWGGEPRDYRMVGQKIWDQEFEKYNAVDLGFGWDRTENVLWRLGHGELDGASPKAAVVMIGTNNLQLNTTDEIARGVTAVCDLIHSKLPKTHILLLAIFPRGAKPDATREKVSAINAILARLDGKNNITFLDIGKTFLEPDGTISKQIMSDYLHPTLKGYDLWAKAMGPTLDKLMN
jgi:lysophospholipase L1-like esterase